MDRTPAPAALPPSAAGPEGSAAAPAADAKPATAPATKSKEERALEWVKAAGMPLVAALITVVGGFLLKSSADERAERESRERLYTQLLVQREQSDAGIRKDMFGVVLREFLAETHQRDWRDRILQLELLVHNFSQTLDLAPLFKDVARRLPEDPKIDAAKRELLLRRLDAAAASLNFKQINGLSRRGYEANRVFAIGAWVSMPDRTVLRGKFPKDKLVPEAAGTDAQIAYALEVVGADLDRREIEVRLRVEFSDDAEAAIDRHFWVGPYDFPMLDNTQLRNGVRASVVITSFDVPDDLAAREVESNARIHLVIFPAASASLKERRDYDDLLQEMLHEHDRDRPKPDATASRIMEEPERGRKGGSAEGGRTP
jgi:hypothetical protein